LLPRLALGIAFTTATHPDRKIAINFEAQKEPIQT